MRIKLHDLILTYERPDPDNAVCARGDHLAAICDRLVLDAEG